MAEARVGSITFDKPLARTVYLWCSGLFIRMHDKVRQGRGMRSTVLGQIQQRRKISRCAFMTLHLELLLVPHIVYTVIL